MDTSSQPPPRAGVVLLAGPSGSGKSSLAARVGLPTVCLDDFYRSGEDPQLPRSELGIVDWDDPASWDAERAFAALDRLVRHGEAEVPNYDIPTNRSTGSRCIQLRGASLVVAEGIFAMELVDRCHEAGILADAICLTHRPSVTFWRRLVRDLREARKPPATLVRRGWALLRDEPRLVADLVARGATPVSAADAAARLHRLASEADAAGDEDAA